MLPELKLLSVVTWCFFLSPAEKLVLRRTLELPLLADWKKEWETKMLLKNWLTFFIFYHNGGRSSGWLVGWWLLVQFVFTTDFTFVSVFCLILVYYLKINLLLWIIFSSAFKSINIYNVCFHTCFIDIFFSCLQPHWFLFILSFFEMKYS